MGIVFHNIKPSAGGIKGKYICQGGIDRLTDGFSEIGHSVKHLLDERFKNSFEAGNRGERRPRDW